MPTVPIRKFGLASSRDERTRMMRKALVDVGLAPDDTGRYPHQLSGGSGNASPSPARWRSSRA
ncbi:MAG: hypothetical protein U0521_23770 [Anaerolineae bacterium]